MSNVLHHGIAWFNAQREMFCSEAIIYRRGDVEHDVNATLGKTVFRIENEYGQIVRYQSRDFMIAKSELPIEPDSGDQIVHNNSLFEVMAPASEPCWRYSDIQKTTYRIHTKNIGTI